MLTGWMLMSKVPVWWVRYLDRIANQVATLDKIAELDAEDREKLHRSAQTLVANCAAIVDEPRTTVEQRETWIRLRRRLLAKVNRWYP